MRMIMGLDLPDAGEYRDRERHALRPVAVATCAKVGALLDAKAFTPGRSATAASSTWRTRTTSRPLVLTRCSTSSA